MITDAERLTERYDTRPAAAVPVPSDPRCEENACFELEEQQRGFSVSVLELQNQSQEKQVEIPVILVGSGLKVLLSVTLTASNA